MSAARSQFPVPIVCSACGAELTPPRCTCAAGTHFTIERGIPRLLFGQKYWGETSSENMARILELTRSSHWRDALQSVVPDEAVTGHLLSDIRADFVHAMPWREIRTALDVGAGMGLLACDLAHYAETVVALEAVPERAQFIQVRAEQDALNIHPIIASAMAMPFAPESFDLITLNGVFEYIGIWGKGDPQALQEQFLKIALGLLRPNGYLYVGIETRLAQNSFMGAIDHSGHAFTTLMPRKMADWYCRVRSKPFYGSEHVVSGYRTYVYTPAEYKAMFERAGFGKVEVHGVFDGYNRQRIIYNLDDYFGRKTLLDRMNPPASLAGRVRRLVADSRMLYRTLESEVAIFARKGPDQAPLVWSELRRNANVVQANTGVKAMAFVFERNRPMFVAEGAKRGANTEGRLVAAHNVVGTAQSLYGDDVVAWPMRWPEPRGTVELQGRTFYKYEYVEGHSIASRLLPTAYSESSVIPLVERVITGYPDFCARLASRWPTEPKSSFWQEMTLAVASMASDVELQRRLQRGLDSARHGNWSLAPVHGDLSCSNLAVRPNGQLVLLDWESFSPSGLVAADLVRFYYDVALDAKRLRPTALQALLATTRAFLAKQLQIMGYYAQDFEALEAVFIAHQVHATGTKAAPFKPLIDLYRTRACALSD
jgi:SAM-dependent methyltransferase/aminoglycoside phosphotransferase (APT) family kinase protein